MIMFYIITFFIPPVAAFIMVSYFSKKNLFFSSMSLNHIVVERISSKSRSYSYEFNFQL
jgi:hypothetical protein